MVKLASDFRALLRNDFYGFIERSFYELNPTTAFYPNWHIEIIADALEACRHEPFNSRFADAGSKASIFASLNA